MNRLENSVAAQSVLVKCAQRSPLMLGRISIILQRLGITGLNIEKLYTDCCGNDLDIFEKTVMLLQDGYIPMEDVMKNFELEKSIPIISDISLIEIARQTGKSVIPDYPTIWSEFCNINADLFLENLRKYTSEK